MRQKQYKEKKEKKEEKIVSRVAPQDVGTKLDFTVLYKFAQLADIPHHLKIDAQWLAEIDTDRDDTWRGVVWNLTKTLRLCRVCGARLRETSRTDRCWPHLYPGMGKEVGTIEDQIRGAKHVAPKRGSGLSVGGGGFR